MRAGVYINQVGGSRVGGYRAFIPKPLPPEPPLVMDGEMVGLLADATLALGRLDGTTEVLPNVDLFVAMYVKKEAVLSSQIEGTQASLLDVLEYEGGRAKEELVNDVGEVLNYIKAMNHGLERLESLPLSLRLICEIHGKLLEGVRGGKKNPGEFRRDQNWIGVPGCTLNEAAFVPPPVEGMKKAMWDLEKYFYDKSDIHSLIRCGLIHSQFETIHPFRDGNGRVGRLLITFYLCHQKVLKRPLLYLSYYFKKFRAEYYDKLMAIRDKGDWEGWIKFFLKGVSEVSVDATNTAKKILDLQSAHKELIQEKLKNKIIIAKTRNNKTVEEQVRYSIGRVPHAFLLLDKLYVQPIISVNKVVDGLGVSFPTASYLIKEFVKMELLKEITGKKRNKLYAYYPYLDILSEGVEKGGK